MCRFPRSLGTSKKKKVGVRLIKLSNVISIYIIIGCMLCQRRLQFNIETTIKVSQAYSHKLSMRHSCAVASNTWRNKTVSTSNVTWRLFLVTFKRTINSKYRYMIIQRIRFLPWKPFTQNVNQSNNQKCIACVFHLFEFERQLQPKCKLPKKCFKLKVLNTRTQIKYMLILSLHISLMRFSNVALNKLKTVIQSPLLIWIII